LALWRRARQAAKSFCFFFQKEVLSSFMSVNNNAGSYYTTAWHMILPGAVRRF